MEEEACRIVFFGLLQLILSFAIHTQSSILGATFCDSSDGTFLGTNDDDHSVTI